ncbi:hypothetical protein [Agromyces sp. NPDC060279]|uniref:hypothetical protein n=1 Tax=Agromyces sp. NPDC060279 TaxID=3347092 RepID=UPI003661E05A
MAALRITGWDVVHLDRLTFMWVQSIRFELDASKSDREQLQLLISSPGYGHDYASPFDGEELVDPPVIHGRWYVGAIHPGRFSETNAEFARSMIRSWVDEQDWHDPKYRQPPEVHERLESVYEVLRSGRVYRLRNPSDDFLHEYGWVTGNLGFHEFVTIDRRSGTLHLVVASDD